jgi:hypothetical protein
VKPGVRIVTAQKKITLKHEKKNLKVQKLTGRVCLPAVKEDPATQ